MLSAFCVFAGMCLVFATQVEKHFGSSSHWLGWSKQVEKQYVSSLTLDEIGQFVAICILVLADVGGVCSTHIEILLCSSWHRISIIISCCDAFCEISIIGQRKLRHFLFPCCH